MQFNKYVFTLCILLMVILQNVNSQSAGDEDFREQLRKAQLFKNVNSDSLIYYVNNALLIAKANNNSNLELDALFVLIKNEIKSSRLVNVMRLCDTANSIAKENNLPIRQIESQVYKGIVYQIMGFASKALEIFISAQKQLEIGKSNQALADLYYYFALLHYELNDFSECHKYLKLSLTTVTNNNSPSNRFSVQMLFANSFDNIDSIQFYLKKAEYLILQYPEMVSENIVLLINLALHNKTLTNYNISRKQFLEAINISKNNGFKDYLLNTYNNYAYLLMAESKYDSVKYYLDQALSISIDINNLDMESEIYDSYSDYYSRIGDFEKAHSYSSLFIEKRDQYRQQQQIQKSLFLSAVFHTEQKEKEILTQENEINRMGIYLLSIFVILLLFIGLAVYFRQRNKLHKSRVLTVQKEKSLEISDAIIVAQDTERKRLAMDLHDGMGARLGALRFLVDDALMTHSRYDDVINSITGIHENVRSISHQMQPPELEKRGLAPAVNNLIQTINKSGSFEIDFEYDIEFELSIKLSTNIYFLVYELINNAIKHSNGNSIFVQLISHETEISLSVEDNGTGFHYDENNAGMGMKNIHTRVDYLGGSIAIESTGYDTSIMIEIPI